MTTALQTTQPGAMVPMDVSTGALIEAIGGDIGKLQPEQRLKYIAATCESVGLNPLTKPFDLIVFQGKTVMYANKGCAEQLRKIHQVTVEILERKVEFGCLVVRVKATDKTGRTDESIAAVPFNERNAEDVAKNMMKCETKAKRRVTLSICGLGMLDESEVETIKGTTTVISEAETSHDFADTVNKSLTEGEKSKAVEVEVVPETYKPLGSGDGRPRVDPTVHSSPTPTPEPQPEPAKEVTAVAEPEPTQPDPFAEAKPAAADDGTIRQLEIVMGENKECIAYLMHKGELAKGAGLETLKPAYVAKVLKHSKQFLSAVDTWVKGGKK